MDVDHSDAFVRGFLDHCAEQGMSKEAVACLIDAAGHLKTAENSPVSNLLGSAIGLPILTGLLAGGGLGYGVAKLTEPEADLGQIRANEIANTYRVYAQRAAARKKMKNYRPPTGF